MALFVEGKTECRISGQLIRSKGAFIGFPITDMPPGLDPLSDSCLLRSSLDGHPRRAELLKVWQQHWIAQAQVPSGIASFNEHGVLMIYNKRFVFAASDSFVELEDQLAALDPLRAFLTSYDGRKASSFSTAWYNYEIAPGHLGTRLVVTRNAAPSTVLRVSQDNTELDHDFMPGRWSGFMLGFAQIKATLLPDAQEYRQRLAEARSDVS